MVVDDSALARAIGLRIRERRKHRGMTQQQLAGDRYTKAYISALETGVVKPSMAALNFIAERLATTTPELLADRTAGWTRLEADLLLASGDAPGAVDAYEALVETETDPGRRAELLRGLAEAHNRTDHPAQAIRAAAESVALFTTLGRPIDRAQAAYWLASAQAQHDNTDEARELMLTILAEVRTGLTVAPDFELRVLVAMATIETYRGNHQAAIGYLEAAQTSTVVLDDRRRGIIEVSLANAYRSAGDHEGAILHGTRAIGLLAAAEAERERAMVANYLALSYNAIGSGQRAAEVVEEATRVATLLGDERLLAHLADTEARIALGRGDAVRALELAESAVARSLAVGGEKALMDATTTRARALLELGRVEESLATFAEAATLARRHAPAARLREVLQAWADALAAAGQHQEAFTIAREALATYDGSSELRTRAIPPLGQGMPVPVPVVSGRRIER